MIPPPSCTLFEHEKNPQSYHFFMIILIAETKTNQKI